METIRRNIQCEVRVSDERRGIATFVASDATIDSYGEIILPSAWKFTHLKKNAPVLADHDYRCEKVIGQLIDFGVTGGKLIETVQFAIDVEENTLARLVWRMVQQKFIRSCSVGFWPEAYLSRNDAGFREALEKLGLPGDAPVRRIYTKVEQIELSIVAIGANPNAVSKAFRAGALSFDEFHFLNHPDTGRAVGEMKSALKPTNTDAVADMLRTLRRAARLR